jgi:hypothetical protein
MVGNGSRGCEPVKGGGTGRAGTSKDPHAKGQWRGSHRYFKGSFDDPAAYPGRNRVFLDAQGNQLFAAIGKKVRGSTSSNVARWNRDRSFRFRNCRFGYGSARAGLSTALGTWGPTRKGFSFDGHGGVVTANGHEPRMDANKYLTQSRKGAKVKTTTADECRFTRIWGAAWNGDHLGRRRLFRGSAFSVAPSALNAFLNG